MCCDNVKPAPRACREFDGRTELLRLRSQTDGENRQLRALECDREFLQVRMPPQLVRAGHDDDVATLAYRLRRSIPREYFDMRRQMRPERMHEGEVPGIFPRLSEQMVR